MAKLTLIRGLPGSGKSTRADLEAGLTGAIHLEADMYYVGVDGVYRFDPNQIHVAHKHCRDACRSLIALGYSVVVSNTFTRINEIQPYKDIAHGFGADFEVIECTGSYGNIHNVPEETLERMRNRWEELPQDWRN